MSRTVENRVVEMQFDNKQFEEGIAESRNSIQQLDKDLQFDNASKGLINLSESINSLDLTNIENGVIALQNRFSTFGIAAMQIIENITSSLISKFTSGVSAVIGQITSGGYARATNIENARFSLQGLLKDEKKVQDVMDVAMDSVDGTAYGFDQAANAASMFVTTGMSAAQLKGPLKAVAGVAAQTNSEYSRIADIFTTVAGNGRVMGDQLRQFSVVGLNAAQVIADYINSDKKLRKQFNVGNKATEAEIRELVSKGKISFSVFSKAMEIAFGDHAKDANKTFNGAMSNIKAALSRIGANFIQPLIKQEGPLVRLFNSIRIAINAINKGLKPFYNTFVSVVTSVASWIAKISKITENGTEYIVVRFDSFMTSINSIFYALNWVAESLFNSFSKFFKLPTIKTLNDMISKFWFLSKEIENYIINNKQLIKIFDGLAAGFNIIKNIFVSVFTIIKNVVKGLAPLGEQLLEILGIFGTKLTGINNWLTYTETLNKIVDKVTDILNPFISLITSVYTIIKNSFKATGGGAAGIIQSFFGILIRSITSTMHAIEELLGIDLSTQIGFVINKLLSLRDVIKLSAPFFDNFINFFKDFGKIIYNSFISAGGGLDGLVNAIFNVMTRAVTTLMHAFEDLTGVDLSKYYGKVILFFKKAKETVLGARDGIQELKDKIKEKWESKEFEGIRNLFENVIETLKNLRQTLADTIDGMNNRFANIDIESLRGVFGGILKFLINAGNVISVVLETIWNAISPFLTDLTTALTQGDIQKVSEIFSSLLTVLAGFRGFQVYNAQIGWIIDLFTKELPNMMTTLANAMNNTAKMPTTLSKWLNAQTENIKYKQVQTVAASILMIAGAAYLLSKIPEEDLLKSMIAVETLLASVAGIMYELSMLSSPNRGFAGPILALSIGVLLLAASMKMLSKIDESALENSFNAIIGLLAGITAAITALTAVEGNLTKVAGTMIALGVAIVLMAASLKMLAKLDPDALSRGFLAITGLIADITTALMLLMAVSSNGGTLSKVAGSMIAIGIAMVLMAASLKMLAKLDQDALGSSFMIMTFMLLEMVGALAALAMLSKSGANVSKAAATMIIAAIAIAILSSALAKMTQEINPDNAAAVLIVLGLALAELAIALTFMQDSLAGAAALVIASVALLMMAKAFETIGSLSAEQILMSIIAMAAAIAILVLAVVGLTMIPGGAAVLLAIAAALLMVGLGFMAMGAGVALIGAGLLMINAALIAFAATNGVVLSNALGNFVIFLQGLRVIIPLIAAIIVDVIVAIAKQIQLRFDIMLDVFRSIVIKILDVLIELLPKLGEFLITLVNFVFDVLNSLIPRLIEFLEVVLDNVLNFLAWALPRIWEFVADLFTNLMNVIGEKGPQLAEAAADMFINLINGMADVIERKEPELKEAINHLIEVCLNAIKDLLGLNGTEPVGTGIFNQFVLDMITGMREKELELLAQCVSLIQGGIDALKEKITESFEIGKNFIQGLIDGIKEKVSALTEAVGNAGADAIEALVEVFDTHSPSRVTELIGENFDQGLINGIINLSDKIAKAAEGSGTKALDQFAIITDKIYALLDDDLDFNPVITPILDDSNLKSGLNDINGMISNTRLNANGSYNFASNIDSEKVYDDVLSETSESNPVVNFTQNNYSPESLSRIDIYRDTKNILSNPSAISQIVTALK